VSTNLLNPIESGLLLRLARDSARFALETSGSSNPHLQQPPAGLSPDSPALKPGRCFVTFKRRSEDGTAPGENLRGCLGTLETREALWKSIARLAADTVTEDPRFRDDPVTAAELPKLAITISVLHPDRELTDPLDFECGVDGIVVQSVGSHRGQRGVFLPQVATEFGWGKEEFLSKCCEHKAHLPADAWKNPAQCRVSAFHTQTLSEK
jgi:AmmeMemoRadiSam system protein A